jgi:hypothetical protein
MVRVKTNQIEHYIDKIEAHLLKRYPGLTFCVVHEGEGEATIYYRPYKEEDDYPILKRAGGIAADALIEAGYKIHIQPAT